ncbi:hypothetical protein EDC04DRAFT_2888509 [Pisolithus marmoratus]|nr:hypothetical protein EDC04DRAFT_2888509 [Pisolithus marmoratus]
MSLAWAHMKYSERTLLVAYLHHGILLWDAIKVKMAHFVYIKTLVGSMSVSRDGNVLVVSNITSGFDIYHLNDSSLDGSMLQPSNGMLVPVAFIHGGQAILGSSTCRKVQIWDSMDRSLLGTLMHDTKDVVLSIAVEPMSKAGKIGSLSLLECVLWRDEESMFNYGMLSRLKMLQAVGFGIKLRFFQDCFELVKAMDEEQKEMLWALEADEVVLQEKLDMFGQHKLDYIEKCAEIAVEVIANDIQNMLQLANGMASASST